MRTKPGTLWHTSPGGIRLNLPYPFKQGDIVACKRSFRDETEHYVIWSDAERGLSPSDSAGAQLEAFCMADRWRILSHGINPLRAEFFGEGLEQNERLLVPLSSFLKDQISKEQFLDECNAIAVSEEVNLGKTLEDTLSRICGDL